MGGVILLSDWVETHFGNTNSNWYSAAKEKKHFGEG